MEDEELQDFLTSFGITGDDTPPGDNGDETPPADNGDDVPPADGDTPPAEGNTPPEGDTPPAQPPVNDKANQMFAAMRVENSTLKGTLQNVARVLGIEGSNDIAAMAEAIQAKALEAQAKQTNMPVEVLQKLERLEKLEHQFTSTQTQQQAILGFQKVAEQFKLDNDGVMAFAAELLQNNINPYETPVDLVREYRDRHWDQIVKAEVEAAVRAEQERAAKATSQGSEPGSNQGGTPGATDKINTVKDLDALMSKW